MNDDTANEISMIGRAMTLLRRHCWEVVLTAICLVLVSCQEIPVDQNTATVTRRPKDTLITIDSIVMRDTTVQVDTILSGRDTLIERDTMVQVRTVVRTVHVIVRDTVITNDTVRTVETVHDTIRKVDTLRELHSDLPKSAKLHRIKNGSEIIDPLTVEIDDLTRIVVQLDQNIGPVALQIQLIGRIPFVVEASKPTYDTVKWGIPPSWLYMVVPRAEINGGRDSTGFVADPWNNTAKAGLAVLPRLPYARVWSATGAGDGNKGGFVIAKVDTASRTIYAYMRARFRTPEVVIDSLSIQFKY